jgi:acetyl-CoA carboxylase beta subunit
MVNKDSDATGYSQEEAYFYNLNQKLIEKKRQEIAAEKGTAPKHPHWMKCPKCGESMEEIPLSGINVDKCTSCNGIYFDHGELEILIDSQEPKGFLSALKKKLF